MWTFLTKLKNDILTKEMTDPIQYCWCASELIHSIYTKASEAQIEPKQY